MDFFTGGLHGAHLRTEIEQMLSSHGIRTEVAEHWLLPYSRSVLVDRDKAAEFNTRAAAALLHAGTDAVLTSHSAVRLHGCTAADDAPIHVLVPYNRRLRPRPDLVVHHGRYDQSHVEELVGLRVLSLNAALADMVCRAQPRTALACLDQTLASLPTEDRDRLRGEIAGEVLARRDIRGRRKAALLLDLASGVPESPAESWTLLVLVEAGLPVPVPQFPVRDLGGRERYRLDFAWPELKIAVEYDGYEAHHGRTELDAARDDDLRRRGWIVVRAAAADLRSPTRFLDELRAAFRHRRVAA